MGDSILDKTEKSFNQRLTDFLISFDRYKSTESTLLKDRVIGDAVAYNQDLINGLIENQDFADEFFVSLANNIKIFKKDLFVDYLKDKNFLDNSYTKFKNKIGFNIKEQLDTNVVLVWPYKDCILEGGQTDEECSKKEIFFNVTLARDEITKLLEAKAFTNFKRVKGEDKEEKLDKFNRNDNGVITDNLLIKGNNLLALHSLKNEFRGKVKLIYIDPPYNTGNDGFKYNDSFNHSTWLTFIKNRLEIAKELLSDDGVIFVQIDNTPSSLNESPELGYLLVMLDDIFKRKNFLTTFTWKKKGNPSNTKQGVGTITESILMYANDIDKISINLLEYKRKYSYEEKGKSFNLEFPVKTNEGTYKRETMLFPIRVKEGTFYPPEGKRWTLGEDTIAEIIKNGKYKIEDGNFKVQKFAEDYIKGENKLYNNMLLEHGSLKSAKDELFYLGFTREAFDSPKPEKLLETILYISTNENDVVLDFFAGSGTTAAVAHKMGRQWITIEQMDYIEDITKKRLAKVIDGEQGGISKSQNWQGGGDFVYMEMNKYNQNYIDKIQDSNNKEELLYIYDSMREKALLRYDVNTKSIEENKEEFEALSFEDLQNLLLNFLNQNMLYQPLSSLEDEEYGLDKEDIKLNKNFYKEL